MEERVPERVRHRAGPGPEFFLRGCRARDQILGHTVGPHRPPLVVVAREPHGVQVFKPPVFGDVLRAQVAVVIDDRLPRGHAVVEIVGHGAGEQKVGVAEGGCHER